MALGPIALATVRRDTSGRRHVHLRPLEEISKALDAAYGPTAHDVIARRCHGLARVAELMAAGDDARARIYAVQIGLPEIASADMAKLAHVATLAKYNPDWESQPRVPPGNAGGGQWTSDGAGVQIAAAGDLKCQGYCSSGGSYGTTAFFHIFGKNLCRDCAVKILGLGNSPSIEQSKQLERYIIGPKD